MAEMFLKLDGIEGESLDHVHENQIEITEWNWKLDNPAPYKMGQADASTKVDIQNITITKLCDKATRELTRCCTLGKHVPSGTITCRKNAGDGKVEYLVIVLTDVMVKTVDFNGLGHEHGVREVVTLSFGEFRIKYKLQDNLGTSASKSIDFAFDIKTHQEKT